MSKDWKKQARENAKPISEKHDTSDQVLDVALVYRTSRGHVYCELAIPASVVERYTTKRAEPDRKDIAIGKLMMHTEDR